MRGAAMNIWRCIKRIFTSRDVRQIYVTLRSRYSFEFLVRLDRDGQKYVVLRLCYNGLPEAFCDLSVNEFDDLVDGVLKVKAELARPLPASATQP